MPPMLLTGVGSTCNHNQPTGPTEGEILAAAMGGGFLFILSQNPNPAQFATALNSNNLFN